MALRIIQIAVGGYDKNFSYVIHDEETRNAVIVDPSGDLDLILETIDGNELDLVGVLITHTHQDHMDKLDELLRKYVVPVYVHENGFEKIVSSGPVRTVKDNDAIKLFGAEISVLHTPGHIDDAVCFYIDKSYAADGVSKLITGDTLFVEGCGRTNKEHVRELYDSLMRLMSYSDETEVYPGHDYGSRTHSTIGYEKEHNKYFLSRDFEEFHKLRLHP